MSITLNLEQEAIVTNLIATGSFQTADEVIQVALKLLETEQTSYQSWVAKTREQVKEGIDSLDRGEGVDGKTVVNELLARLRQEVLSLPRASRELLAEKLVESLEFDIDPEIQSAWNTEAKKRLDEMRSGAVQGISRKV